MGWTHYLHHHKMKLEKKMTNVDCAELLGVGRPTITAVRKMLGIPAAARKTFPSLIHDFLKKHSDFQLGDAKDRRAMLEFKGRHPRFNIPVENENSSEPGARHRQ